ncbi:uncharacterized protein BDW70DRAFT_75139 [Aspergillus foveolatus]|uniref:uncharacterized protein n=1 Tax=Aspergillus foveolatus TaxID=210207 RepID=UPI003CCD4E4C
MLRYRPLSTILFFFSLSLYHFHVYLLYICTGVGRGFKNRASNAVRYGSKVDCYLYFMI